MTLAPSAARRFVPSAGFQETAEFLKSGHYKVLRLDHPCRAEKDRRFRRQRRPPEDQQIGCQRLGFLEGIPARMRAGLALVDITVPVEPANMGIVVADLLYNHFLSRQIVNAAIANMPEIHPAAGEPANTQGCSHAGAFRITLPNQHQRLMNLVKKSGENVGKISFDANGGLLERSLEEMRHPIHGDPAGEFSGGGAPHSVAYREGEISGFRRCFAVPS